MKSYKLMISENRELTCPVLDEEFFSLPTLKLAQELLGCILIKETEEGVSAGYIVETEAYIGPEDRASHAFGNRRTKRTEIMFKQAGLSYTYIMHTHCLVNVVSGPPEKPEAVLIRALEPLCGIQLMKRRRKTNDIYNLTNGPGKLTKALGISMEDYGRSFTAPPLLLAKGKTPKNISQGKRIGIDNSREARDYPWRFWITDNPHVSKKPKK